MKQQPVRNSLSILTVPLLAALFVVSMGMISGNAAAALPSSAAIP